jgi:hypothetical protein
MNRETNKTARQIDKLTDRHMDRRTERQIDRELPTNLRPGLTVRRTEEQKDSFMEKPRYSEV